MAARIPHSELVVLPSAKHCGLFELHEQFHEAMIGFLATSEDDFRRRVKQHAEVSSVPSETGVS
jgi:hypothetical protein